MKVSIYYQHNFYNKGVYECDLIRHRKIKTFHFIKLIRVLIIYMAIDIVIPVT